MNETIIAPSSKKIGWEMLGYIFMATVFFLLPVFVFPLYEMPLDIGKKFLLIAAVSLGIIFWLAGRIKSHSVSISKNSIYFAGLLIIIISAVSALFSSAKMASLIGAGYERATVFSLAVFMLTMFLSSVYFNSKKRIVGILFSLLISFLIVFVFQALQIFTQSLLPFYSFQSNSANLIGKWNDLSIFSGLILLLSIMMMEMFSLKSAKLLKYGLYAAMAGSFILLVMTNFRIVWIAVGVLSLLTFGYIMAFSKNEEGNPDRRVLRLSSVAVVIALIFTIFGGSQQFLGKQINNINAKIGISVLEVRPSMSGTLTVAKNTLKKSALLGSGPETFSSEWVKYHPKEVNSTPFWNINFNSGSGFLPTMLVMLGILGALGWIYFILAYLYSGYKAIVSHSEDPVSKSLVVITFLISLFLWIVAFFYTSDTVILGITFMMTGLFIASLVEAGILKSSQVYSPSTPKESFILTVSGVVLIVLCLGGLYFVGGKYLAGYMFQKGMYALNLTGDIQKADSFISRAANLDGQDVYYGALASIKLSQMKTVIEDQKLTEEQKKEQFALLLNEAIKNAQKAREANPLNLSNFLALGQVYEAVVPLGVDGAYKSAKDTYESALSISKNNPLVYFSLARLEAVNKNAKGANEYLKKSLEIKDNYAPALYMLAQMDLEKGDTKAAIEKVEKAAIAESSDPSAWFQLGYMKYQNGDYEGARDALLNSVYLNPVYSNAKYFLGLSYDKLGETEKAIKEFEDIERLNPDNAEVKSILSGLKGTVPVIEDNDEVEGDNSTTTDERN